MLARQARAFLDGETEFAGFRVKKTCGATAARTTGKFCVDTIGQFDVLLAIKKEGEPFFSVRVDGNTCLSKDVRFAIFCYVRGGKTNGINTEFKVSSPSGYKVYAIRRVTSVVSHFTEGIYTPYSDELNTPEVRRYGKAYLERMIQEAYQDLAERGVRSLRHRNEFVHDRVPKDIIEYLIVIEHLEHGRLRRETLADLMQEVYAVVGLNQSIAFGYTKSPASARGLMQVIPSTYGGLRRIYPSAGLLPEFVEGTLDHENAVKAAALLIDHDIGIIPHIKMRDLIRDCSSSAKCLDYVSSAYNGGPYRALRLLLSGQDHVIDNSNLENKVYVAKMRAVAKVVQDHAFAVFQ